MERELESKIFSLMDFESKEQMEISVKDYMNKMRKLYPNAIVTKEFFKGNNVLVRVVEINSNIKKEKEEEKQLYIEGRIKELGINGIGENVNREKTNGKSREYNHSLGGERERGGR